MIYILKISKVNPPDLFIDGEFIIDRLIRLHTSNSSFVVKMYVDEELPNGYVIEKEDDLLTNKIQNEEFSKKLEPSYDTILKIERKILEKQAKFENDTSITQGEKPYEPKVKNSK